jgi:hypothetical protein
LSQPRRRLALFFVAGLMSGAACVPISSGPDGQDACQIGRVSPENYRIIATEVTAMPPIDWEEALAAERQADGVAAAVHERLEQVLAGHTTTDERIGAMHAVMRGIGAELAWATAGSRGDIIGVVYYYRLDVNRVGLTRFLSRWAELVIWLEMEPGAGDVAELTRVVVLMPEMLEPGRPGWKKPAQVQPCPPMPLDTPTLQDRIEEQRRPS